MTNEVIFRQWNFCQIGISFPPKFEQEHTSNCIWLGVQGPRRTNLRGMESADTWGGRPHWVCAAALPNTSCSLNPSRFPTSELLVIVLSAWCPPPRSIPACGFHSLPRGSHQVPPPQWGLRLSLHQRDGVLPALFLPAPRGALHLLSAAAPLTGPVSTGCSARSPY